MDLQSDAVCTALETELLCLLLILCISAESDGVNRALSSCQESGRSYSVIKGREKQIQRRTRNAALRC